MSAINLSVVTTALRSQLATYLAANGSAPKYRVARADILNLDRSLAPWVGIYRVGSSWEPRTLGATATSWKVESQIRVLTQAQSERSGDQAEDRCDLFTKEVVDGVYSDRTIGGTIVNLAGPFVIQYSYRVEDNASLFFHMSDLTITVEMRAGP